MWEQAIWPLLISLIMNINGEGHQTLREGTALIQKLAIADSNPARALVDMQAPIMVIPVKTDQHDRILEDSPPRSVSDIQLIGWAGPGEPSTSLTAPPSLDIPKWIPDFQPIKEKHWDAIVHAIDNTWKQDSKNNMGRLKDFTTSIQESFKPTPSESFDILLPLHQTPFKDLSNVETKNSIDRNYYNSPLSSTTKFNNTAQKVSSQTFTDGFEKHNFFNPLNIFLPDHIRHKDEKQTNVNNRRRIHHQNLDQWSTINSKGGNTRVKQHLPNVGTHEETKQVKFVTWPNTEPKNQVRSIITQSPSNRKNIFNNTVHITQLTRPVAARENSNPTIPELEVSESKASLNAVILEQHPKQWSNTINVVSSPTITTASLKTDPLKLNITTLQSPNFAKHLLINVSSQADGITPPSTSASFDLASHNQLSHTEYHGRNFSLENDKAQSKTQTNSKQKHSENLPIGNVYDQPWLHAAVQHDLKQWGYPYDKEATPYPYVDNSNTQVLQQNTPNLTTSSFSQSSVGNQAATQKENPLLPSKQEQHLAIIEVPRGTDNRPIPIKNIHVIAPKPDNVPPVPLFRPSERKEINSSPYLLQRPEARSPGIKNNDPMLVVPYPSVDSDNISSSEIYPVFVPLNKASDRQDDTPFQMIIRPLRNMFQFGRNTGNVPPNKPISTRQILPTEQVPADIQPTPIHSQEFPGFGPPKDDDVVSFDTPPLQQVDEINEILSNEQSIPKETQEGQSLHSQQQQHQDEIPTSNVPLPQQNEFPTTFNHPQTQHQIQFQSLAPTPVPNFQTGSQNNGITQNQHQLLRPPPVSFRPRPFRQTQNHVLPPVLNTFRQNPPELNSHPKRPTTQSFRPWPDTRQPTTVSNTLFDTQELRDSNTENLHISTTSRPSFSFFNRPPTLPSFRMPTLPNMRFLNPFNMFRSRENANSGFSLFPSLFSKSDKDGSFARENGAPSYSLQPNHSPSNSPQTSSHEAKTKFLRNIKSPSSKQEGAFTFMPHLPPVFKNNEIPAQQKTPTQLQPPPATHYSLSKPLLQPPPVIYNLKQNNDYVYQNTKDNIAIENNNTPTSLNNSSTDNSEEAIFIVSSDKRDSSEWQNADNNVHPITLTHSESTAAVVNPQTNPARQSIFQKETNDMHLGPPLIKFTLDDVVKSPETLNKGDQIITEVPQTNTDNFKHVLFEEDMEFAPSEEVVTIAEFSEAKENATPISLLVHNVKPTTKSEHVFTISTAKKEQIYTTTPKSQDYFTHNTPKTTSSLTALNLNAKNMPQITTPPNFTPTTIQNNNSPVTFSTYISTIKALPNDVTQTPDSNPFPLISWMTAQPQDSDPNKVSENKERLKQNNLSAAASSKVTIIEATPMPKQGEIFPTVTHFDSYTTTPTTATTTTKFAATDYASIKFVTTANNDLHINNQQSISNTDQNNHEVLLPGRSNHRTMNRLPKVELDPTANSNSQSTSRAAEQNSNKLKIRYNAPQRKVFHAHRDELQSSVIKGTPPTSTAPITVPEKGHDHNSSTLSSTKAAYQDPITEASFEITSFMSPPTSTNSLNSKESNTTFSKELHPTASYEDSLTQSSIPTTATVRSYLAGKPSRYNSFQRLRDSISRKRTDTNTASELPFTTPSVPTEHTTKHPFTLPTASTNMPKRLTAVSTTNLTRSFPSFRTHISSLKTAPTTKLLETKPLSTTTRKPHQYGTHLPKQTTANFKQTDYEPSESGSSSSYEWRPPIHDVFLQDHPDMLNIHNWESTRLNYPQDRSDVQPKFENHNSQYGGADTMLSDASNVSSVAVLGTRELTPLPLSLLSSDFSVSTGIPAVIFSKRNSHSSSSTKVHEETSSSQSNNAWKAMTRSIEQGETPYTSILSSLHNNEPMTLRT